MNDSRDPAAQRLLETGVLARFRVVETATTSFRLKTAVGHELPFTKPEATGSSMRIADI